MHLRGPGLVFARMREETLDATRDDDDASPAVPGAVLVFAGGAPRFVVAALEHGALAIGRGAGLFQVVTDDRLSRQHAEVRFAPDRGWTVRDCGSRNGTFVDGARLQGSATSAVAPSGTSAVTSSGPGVVRVADSIVLLCDDIRRLAPPLVTDGIVVGATLRAALDEVARAAESSETLLLRGESGTGKEMAARAFHAHGPSAGGPLVAVNCAAIPAALAERLLFGTRRGAYSGAAADARGHVQEADGGVLFLDEGGELDLEVQAKLLRVLETREVVPLGASHGQRVDVRVCVATHRDLRASVAAGGFRADLYHRIAPPEVVLPPLRARRDEIAHHVAAEIAAAAPSLTAHPRLVEQCMLRAWPGNVRELRKGLRAAAIRARAQGELRVRTEHLGPSAGLAFEAGACPAPANAAPPAAPADPAAPAAARGYVRWSSALTRGDIERALAAEDGSVARAARALGMGRTQLYREMARREIVRPGADGRGGLPGAEPDADAE